MHHKRSLLLNRRNLLRGLAGIGVGLPFLESLAPKPVQAAQAQPKRLVIFFCANGVYMDKFWPTSGFGALTPDSMPEGTGLHPVASYASHLLIARGMFLTPRGFGRDPAGGDDHAKCFGHRLTAAPNQDTEENYASGVSIDQVVARSINPGGKGPLNLMVGYRSTDVRGSISYTGPAQQAVPFQDPWKAFKDWATGGSSAGGAALDRAAKRRQSVLDLVKTEFDSLKSNRALSQSDRDKLDMHFTAIREVEQGMSSTGVVACSLSDSRQKEIEGIDPKAVTLDSEYEAVGGMMLDVLALALACGQNRVATLQWGSGAGGPIFSWVAETPDDVETKYNHHKLSHGATVDNATKPTLPDEQWHNALYRIDTWYMTRFKELLDRLSSYTEPGGTVLDNSAVCYMNDMSDGLKHLWMDLPTIIAGSCGGYFKQGQMIKLTKGDSLTNDTDAPSNKVLTTLANAVGATNADGSAITDFGSSPTGQPGEFEELKA